MCSSYLQCMFFFFVHELVFMTSVSSYLFLGLVYNFRGWNVRSGTHNHKTNRLTHVCSYTTLFLTHPQGVVRAMDVIEATFENADGSPGTPPSFKGFDSPASRYFINALGFGLGICMDTKF